MVWRRGGLYGLRLTRKPNRHHHRSCASQGAWLRPQKQSVSMQQNAHGIINLCTVTFQHARSIDCFAQPAARPCVESGSDHCICCWCASMCFATHSQVGTVSAELRAANTQPVARCPKQATWNDSECTSLLTLTQSEELSSLTLHCAQVRAGLFIIGTVASSGSFVALASSEANLRKVLPTHCIAHQQHQLDPCTGPYPSARSALPLALRALQTTVHAYDETWRDPAQAQRQV